MEDDTPYTGSEKKDEGSMTTDATPANVGAAKRGVKTEADELRESVKQKVAKGVAAVAGALKGFSEEAKHNDLAGSAKQAVQKAGETTRELAGTAKQEFQRTKEHLSSGGSAATLGSASDTARGYESKPMGDPMGGTLSGVETVPDLRKTPLGTQSDLKEKTSPSNYISGTSVEKKDDAEDDSSTMNDSH